MAVGCCGALLILGVILEYLCQLWRILINQILRRDKNILIGILNRHIAADSVPENVGIFPAGQHKVDFLRRTVGGNFLPFNRNPRFLRNFFGHFLVFGGYRAVRPNHHRNGNRLHLTGILHNRKRPVQIKIVQAPGFCRTAVLLRLAALRCGRILASCRNTHAQT